MQHLTTLESLQTWRNEQEDLSQRVVLVPTMGALHEGHLQLMKLAKLKGQKVVVSIFVNPLQFGVNEDFSKYPRTLTEDLTLCERVGVDAVWTPSVTTLYPDTFAQADHTERTVITPPHWLTDDMCGKTRPGHFTGVATVVFKLMQCVKPHVAVFGQKDAQQLRVIQHMVAELMLPVEIVSHPIVREPCSSFAQACSIPQGLAKSSRNRYLETEAMYQAGELFACTLQVIRESLLRVCQSDTPPQETLSLEAWMDAHWKRCHQEAPQDVAPWSHKEYLLVKHWHTWTTLDTLDACWQAYQQEKATLLLAGVSQIKRSSEEVPRVRLLDNHLLVPLG